MKGYKKVKYHVGYIIHGEKEKLKYIKDLILASQWQWLPSLLISQRDHQNVPECQVI